MADQGVGKGGEDLDPDIRRFVQTTGAAYGRYPNLATLSPAEAREIAEEVRAPWREGGPAMARTQEHLVDTPHGKVRIRVYEPVAGQGASPALIYLHGGGWTLFSLDTHDRVMREYAARSGMVVIGVDYSLSPEVKFPVALEQCVAVAEWLSEHGAALGVDPARMAMGGDSAGANLSVGTALTLRDAGRPDLLKGLLLLYGAFQRDCSQDYHDRFGGPGYMLSSDEMVDFWSNYLSAPSDAENPLIASAFADLKGLPPVMLTIPACDVLTGQSLDMAERLKSAGVAVSAEVYPGATHSFIEAMSIAQVAVQALDDGSAWLKRTI